jgi:hypothetical protein
MKKSWSKPCKVINNCNIYGNNHNIKLINGFELTDKEKSQFDYMDNNEDNFTGFRYRGNVYSLSDFMRTENNDPFIGFADGYHSDSYFSGILVKFNEGNESVKAYTYIS